jgi:elongation factor G
MSDIDLGKVHNVGIYGHGGVGKTSLVEQILHDAGVTNRRGRIEEGNTVCDYLDEEIAHKHSIQLTPAHVSWEGARIHLVDHPGYSDFIGELAASAPVLDTLIIVVDAAAPIQVGTDNAWSYAERYKVPRAFFVNKLDRENTDFNEAMRAIREVYGKHCVPLIVPVGKGEKFERTINILDTDDPSMAAELKELHDEIQDAVAEADDALLEKFLEAGELTLDELHQGLHDGIANGKIVPIIAGSVDKNHGIKNLLHVIAESFPCPLDRHVIVEAPNGEKRELKVSPDEPFVGQVFRSMVDPFVGHLTIFRVFTGTLKTDSEFYNVTRGVKERTGKLMLITGKDHVNVNEVVPGDIAAMTKLKNTHFGDTIAAAGVDVKLSPPEMPEPLVKMAIVPKSRADEDKIGEALHRLAEEDPTFRHYRDPETNEHVIKGMGDTQLAILLERMKNKFHVEADTQLPKVAYLESIRGKAEVQGKYKKQSGGHGQYGDCHLRISPNERGAGYEFIDSVVGGVVPKQYIPAVDKGAYEALQKGVISGNRVVDVKVELFFGSFHTVDSSEMAFKVAASLAIQKGIKEANPCILEPVVELSVTVPDDYMGDITGDLNSRRGRILGMEAAGPGRQTIRANVPESEILSYSTVLRSITGGRGSYKLKFSHYDELPEHLAKPMIEEHERAKAAGE